MIGQELADRGFTQFLPDLFDEQCRLMTAHTSFAGKTTLELGARDGRHSEAALAMGARQAVAVEYRPEASWAVGTRADRPVHFVYGDCRTVDLPDTFDIVMAYGILYHVPNPGWLLRHMFTWAREWVFISTHCADSNRDESGGYRGEFRGEGGGEVDAATLEQSLWLSRSELRRAIGDQGGTIVQEHEYVVGSIPAVWLAVRL